MEVRRSRFIRMGSKIGAGVIIGAFLAVVPVSPVSATHLANITLSNTVVAQGQPFATLNGVVDNATDAAGCEYGWDIDPVNPASATTDGADFSAPTPGVHWVQPYTVKVATASLAPGVYPVQVKVTWFESAGCDNDGPEFANATITVRARQGTFNCSAYAARTKYDYQPANPNYSPCKDDLNYFAQVQPILGLGNVGAVRALTDLSPDVPALPTRNDYANAEAHVEGTDFTISGVRIRTGALWSQSATNCTGGTAANPAPRYNTNGTVATLNANGRFFGTTSGYLKVQILNVTIEINKVITTSTSRTRQALVITRNSFFSPLKIVVAETKVGVTGNPCR